VALSCPIVSSTTCKCDPLANNRKAIITFYTSDGVTVDCSGRVLDSIPTDLPDMWLN
jgi:hypothetical protein